MAVLRFLLAGCVLVLFACALAPAGFAQADVSEPEGRGVWVLDSRLGSRQMIEEKFGELAAAGFNTVYLRTWYQGATLYPSDVVEAAGGPRQHARFAGRDPIAEAIEIGQALGLQVGAWMEYGLVAHASYDTTGREPGPILSTHPTWSMLDREGRIATTPAVEGGLRFYWMDPAHPEVVAFLREMAAELAARYPDLALYEADRFRYPSLDWSYSTRAVDRYRQETGNRDPIEIRPGDADYTEWKDWRRQQTTHLMGEVYRAVKAANPSVAVSAAVVPPYMIDTVYDKLQYWPAWADSGYVDVMEPMLYVNDNDYASLLSRARSLLPGGVPLYAGISADAGGRSNLSYQIDESRRQGTEGVVVWYEGALTAEDRATLGRDAFARPATLPHDDRIVDDAEAVFSTGGSWTPQEQGYAGGSHRLAKDAGGEAVWTPTLLRSGYYDLFARWTPDAANTPRAAYRLRIDGSEVRTVDVDQRQGTGWQHLGHLHLDYDAHVEVGLAGSSEGAVIADAVRLLRVAPFRATEVLAGSDRRVYVRFSYAPDPETVVPGAFRVDGAAVEAAALVEGDDRVAVLETSSLDPDTDYALHVNGLVDRRGRALVPGTLAFAYAAGAAERLVDDGDDAFFDAGTWTVRSTGQGYGGSDFLLAAGAVKANQARWVAVLEQAGRHEVEVYLPPAEGERTARAGYVVGHSAGFDTVYVDQQRQEGWTRLGIYRYDAQSTSFVLLAGGLSGTGEMAADAVRFRRTLMTSVVEPALPGAAFRIEALYPNPLQDTAHLRFTLGTPGAVEAVVYDVLGRRVLAPPERTYTAGTHEMRLDASRLAAGAYFVRLTHRAGGRLHAVTRGAVVK